MTQQENKPLCGLPDWCEAVKHHWGKNTGGAIQECKTCLAIQGRPIPDHKPHIITLTYLSLAERARVMPGLVERWYLNGALDDLDVTLISRTLQAIGG